MILFHFINVFIKSLRGFCFFQLSSRYILLYSAWINLEQLCTKDTSPSLILETNAKQFIYTEKYIFLGRRVCIETAKITGNTIPKHLIIGVSYSFLLNESYAILFIDFI